jgi:hypothetical protein
MLMNWTAGAGRVEVAWGCVGTDFPVVLLYLIKVISN